MEHAVDGHKGMAAFVTFIWVPDMLHKERSLSRNPEWEDYVARTGLLVPKR